MLNAAQRSVRDFSSLLGLPISNSPRQLARERVLLRAKWMSEEIREFREAADIIDQLDAIADLIYYALGVFVEMGVDGGKVFRFVHEANMTKGKPGVEPVYGADGKVLKPKGWVPPKGRIRKWLDLSSPGRREA